MFDPGFLRQQFQAARTYADHVATGTEAQQAAWRDVYERARLTDAQRRLVEGFVREMHLLVLSGVWCGDCAQQCPLIARIAEANPDKIHLRFADREELTELSDRVQICGGKRVPVAIFAAEDFAFCSLLGDRTLSRYRALAARQLGPACPLPGAPVPDDELAATLADWLAEFERVQLMLRTSPRLRRIHDD